MKFSSGANSKEKLSSQNLSESKLKSNLENTENLTLELKTKTSLESEGKLQKLNLMENSNFKIKKMDKSLSQSSLTTKNCSPLCAQCSTNDMSYCTLCQTAMIFYNYNCYITCPEGTFLNHQTRTCKLCHSNCPICWGPEKDMCGNTFGFKTVVVSLEDEIREYLNTHIFIKEEVDTWLNSLKIIFNTDKSELIYPLFSDDNSDNNHGNIPVYINDKKNAEIPIGSFTYKNSLLIPVPPYINKDKKLIEFHWVYKNGMWDGVNWSEQWFPKIPSFIQYKGTTDKIYQENNGFWYYDPARNWIYVKVKNVVSTDIIIEEKILTLNKIKIDVIHYK
jgi:hypothetical protein